MGRKRGNGYGKEEMKLLEEGREEKVMWWKRWNGYVKKEIKWLRGKEMK